MIQLKDIRITDAFWQTEQELVRTEVIPYQWEALNDRVPGAAPSFAIHNFLAAGALRQRAKEPGFRPPVFGNVPFNVLPEDPEHPDPDTFYGFVFQATDLYKWLEAVAYSLISRPDPALQATAEKAIRLIADAQAEDGYLDTYYILNGRDKSFTDLQNHHELYCFGHLTEAAVAWHQATGSDSLLQIAERFAACIGRTFGPEKDKKHGYPGHEIAEMALVRLYEETGKKEYLDLSSYFVDERGKQPCYFASEGHKAPDFEKPEEPYSYYQAHKPVRQQEEAKGHAVRAMYLYSGMADLARLTGDASLTEACRKLFRSVTREKMYITGGVGSTHIGEAFTFPFDLPNDLAYTESCAAIGLCFFAHRMLRLEPKAEYGDILERALYNNVLSGMALDGKSFFYVNPLEVWPEAVHRDARKLHVKSVRQKWFGCACCPPNIARFLGSLGAYAFTEEKDTLFVHLYMSAEITRRTPAGDCCLRIAVDRSDPARWLVRISSDAKTAQTLAFRLPGWSRGYTLQGADSAETWEQDGYLYLRTEGPSAGEILLELPCPVRFLRADTRVREDSGKIAVMHGPFVYCLEEKDNGKDLNLISLGSSVTPGDAAFAETEIAGRTAPLLLLPGRREPAVTDRGLYYDTDRAGTDAESVILRLIPYYMWANRGEGEMQVWIPQR